MGKLKYWQSINQALQEEMERDSSVVIIGEDIGSPGGTFGSTRGLYEKFGPTRVKDTPISELAITGMGVGAAMTGLRPVVEIMFNDFSTLAMDQIINQAAKMSFMSGGKIKVPLVIRTLVASGKNTGPQHGQSLEALFAHIPGIKVVWPSNPSDMKGLLKSAIRDNNPVIVFESLSLWASRGDVPEGEYLVPIGKAKVVKEGTDVSIITLGGTITRVLEASKKLKNIGISTEIVDLRSVSPLDEETIIKSVSKTGRMVVVHDAVKQFGFSAEVITLINEKIFNQLKAPPKRIGAPYSPVPFSPVLEREYFPQTDTIYNDIKDFMLIS